MGRLRAFIILFLCICLLRVPVSAASAVSQLHSSAVLDGAGAGRVSLRRGGRACPGSFGDHAHSHDGSDGP